MNKWLYAFLAESRVYQRKNQGKKAMTRYIYCENNGRTAGVNCSCDTAVLATSSSGVCLIPETAPVKCGKSFSVTVSAGAVWRYVAAAGESLCFTVNAFVKAVKRAAATHFRRFAAAAKILCSRAGAANRCCLRL